MTLQELVTKVTKRVIGPMQWTAAAWRIDQRGDLKGSNEDIPAIIQEIHDDVTLRHKDAIVAAIYNVIKSDILKEAVRGVGKWYKEQVDDFKADVNDDIDIGTPAVA